MNPEFVELEDPITPDYEPSDEEVREYAEWLGAKLPRDESLLWIARDALKAQIPKPWKYYQRKDGTGDPFYFNPVTGSSIYDHPLDEHFRNMMEENIKQNLREKADKQFEKSISQKSQDASFFMSDSETEPTEDRTPAQKPTSVNVKQTNIEALSSSSISLKNRDSDISKLNDQFHADIRDLSKRHIAEIEAEQRKHLNELQQLRDTNEAEIQNEKRKLSERFENEIALERQKYEQDLDRLRRSNQEKLNNDQRNQLKNLRDNFEEQKRNYERDFKNEIDVLQQEHNKQMQRLKENLDREKESMVKRNERSIADLKIELQNQLANQKKLNEDDVNNMKQKCKDEIANIKKQCENTIIKLKRQQQQAINRIKANNDIERLNEEHQIQLQNIKEQNQKEIDRIISRHASKKNEILELYKEELAELTETQKRKFEEQKKVLTSLERENDLVAQNEKKRQRIQKRFEDEITELNEEHEFEMQEQRRKNQRQLDILHNEEEKMKLDLERMKQEFKEMKFSEINKLNEDFEEEIEQLKTNFSMQKQQEKTRFIQDMQLMMTYLENQKIEAESQIKFDIEAKKNRSENRNKIKAVKKNYQICSQKKIDIIPSTATLDYSKQIKYSFSTQRIFQQKEQSRPSILKQPEHSISYHPTEIRYQSSDQYSQYYNKSRNKISKVEEQFDMTCDNLSNSIRDSQNRVGTFSKAHRDFITSQQNTISQLAADFRAQANGFSRSIQSALSELENVISQPSPNPAPVRYVIAPPQPPANQEWSEESESSIDPDRIVKMMRRRLRRGQK